jgi:hypothetical protein
MLAILTLHEPMTLVTDYVLGVVALVFGLRLWRRFRLWALAFFCTAAGSLLGGTFHGFGPHFTPLAALALWHATVLSIGLASCFFLAGLGRPYNAIAVIKFVVFASWMITHDAFIWVIVDYGVTFLLIAAAQVAAWVRSRAPSAPWLVGSVIVALVAAAVQAGRVTLHPRFNHNDLYHAIQLVGLWMLFRAGVRMSETVLPTSQPM